MSMQFDLTLDLLYQLSKSFNI